MILVSGATGSLGGRITRSLLAQGKDVRILARHNSPSEMLAQQGRANTAASLEAAGAQVVYGDLKDRASLDALCAGIDTVVTTATATQRDGEDTIERVDLQGTQNLIAAARAAGVKRFIYTSVPGAAIDHPLQLFAFKGACEDALVRSGMEYTIFQPAIYMQIWIGMIVGLPLAMGLPITLIGEGSHHHNFVSEADVAAFEVAAVDNPKAANQRIPIGGPASYTWTEIVQNVGKAMGRELPVRYVAPGADIPGLPPAVFALFNGMETFESYVDMSETAPAYGVTLTTLEQFIQRTFVRDVA